jgi:hypothetical protein
MKKILRHIHDDDNEFVVGIILIALMIATLCIFFTMGTASLINAIQNL